MGRSLLAVDAIGVFALVIRSNLCYTGNMKTTRGNHLHLPSLPPFKSKELITTFGGRYWTSTCDMTRCKVVDPTIRGRAEA